MSGRWYKRCGADFIHGTMMLTLEEKGAYSLCLDLIYDRGGPIPDDARWLAGVCGVSIRKWNTIRARLVSLGKLTVENELISNFRAGFELVSTDLQARERAESGAKGGRKRAENAAALNGNSDLAQAELKYPFKQIRVEEIREERRRDMSSGDDPAPSELKPEHVVEAWNATAQRIGLATVRKLTPARQRQLQARIRANSIDDFTEAIAAIERSPFLRGENDRGWKANFDFLLQPASFTKLIEGTYDR